MAADAFAGELGVCSIRFEIHALPPAPSPSCCRGVLRSILHHELDLQKPACMYDALFIRRRLPCDLREDRAIGPRLNLLFGDGLHRNIVRKDLAQGMIVLAIGGANRLPVLVVRKESQSV